MSGASASAASAFYSVGRRLCSWGGGLRQIDVYHFDPYSQALAKLERALVDPPAVRGRVEAFADEGR